MMRDSGQIKSLDNDISLYYPEFKVQNPFQTERGITFRQLMSHMSGLGRDTPCKGIFDTGCNATDEEIMKNIAGMKLMYPPGTQPAYSNLGFGLLGKVLTRIAKARSWDDLLNKMILQPLGMNNTGNSFKNYDPKKTAIGYYPDGSEADFIDIGWDASAGQSYSSTADLAKLMSLVFSTTKSSKDQVLANMIESLESKQSLRSHSFSSSKLDSHVTPYHSQWPPVTSQYSNYIQSANPLPLSEYSQPLTPLRIQPTPYPSQNTANPLPLSEYRQPLTPLRIQPTPYPSQNTANPLPLSEYSQPLTPLRIQTTPYPSQNTAEQKLKGQPGFVIL